MDAILNETDNGENYNYVELVKSVYENHLANNPSIGIDIPEIGIRDFIVQTQYSKNVECPEFKVYLGEREFLHEMLVLSHIISEKEKIEVDLSGNLIINIDNI